MAFRIKAKMVQSIKMNYKGSHKDNLSCDDILIFDIFYYQRDPQQYNCSQQHVCCFGLKEFRNLLDYLKVQIHPATFIKIKKHEKSTTKGKLLDCLTTFTLTYKFLASQNFLKTMCFFLVFLKLFYIFFFYFSCFFSFT